MFLGLESTSRTGAGTGFNSLTFGSILNGKSPERSPQLIAASGKGVIVIKDETLEEARSGLEHALRTNKSARSRLGLAQRRYERLERSLTYSRRMRSEANDRKLEAERSQESSRRTVADHRSEVKSEERWEADSRKWGGQAQSASRELERWEAELRRAQTDSQKTEVKSDPRAYGIVMRAADAARTKAERARGRKLDLDRRAQDSRRRGEDARRENRARNLEVNESQKWEDQSTSAEREMQRWSNEIRRYERDAISLSDESKQLRGEIDKASTDISDLRRRVEILTAAKGAAAAVPLQPPPMPLVITQRAATTLKVSLDNIEHQPEQLLRLNTADNGAITLAVDDMVPGDRVVTHGDSPVGLVGFPLAGALRGKTIDSMKTPQGTSSLIIS